MNRIDLKNHSLEELEALMIDYGEKPFRAHQLGQWIYRQSVNDFDNMKNISKVFRRTLKKKFFVYKFQSYESLLSQDGSRKYIFTCQDGSTIEGVSIPDLNKITFCLSTQVGCPLGCTFCLTGQMGFRRNLATSEIIEQFLIMKRHEGLDFNRINVVLMGMGEPLLNYKAVDRFLDIAINDHGLGLSTRKITLSTAGILPVLKQFSQKWPNIQLAVSMNASNQAIRSEVMPISVKYDIEKLLEFLKVYPLPRRRSITLEYVLIKDINDKEKYAYELAAKVKGLRCKINLIPYNPVQGLLFEKPGEKQIDRFSSILHEKNLTVMVRRSRGTDVGAACGQLGKLNDT